MSDKSTMNNYVATSSITGDVASLKWKIKGFSVCCCTRVGSAYKSPAFHSSDATWHLEIFPNLKADAYAGHVLIILWLDTTNYPDKSVSFTISLQDKNGSDHYVYKNEHEFSRVPSHSGAVLLIEKKLLLEGKREELLPEDTLTVCCQLIADCTFTQCSAAKTEEIEPILCSPDPLEKLAIDFENVFEKKKYSDVVLLSSDDQKFPVHKAILEERSSVFAAMFEHDMAETRLGEVRIEDIDGVILKHLLRYIYTAKIHEIEDGDVSRLYIAADKYNVECLKKECTRRMLRKISIDNVCDILALADDFNDRQLKESALSFLYKDHLTVMKSNSWKELSKDRPHLAVEILETIFLDK